MRIVSVSVRKVRICQDAEVGPARRFLRTLFLPFFTTSGSVFLAFSFLRAGLSITMAGMRAGGSRSRWRLGFSALSDMSHTDRTCKPSINSPQELLHLHCFRAWLLLLSRSIGAGSDP